MALPGVRTVLKDRFYTLTRTDVPDGPRVVGIAERNADTEDPTASLTTSTAGAPGVDEVQTLTLDATGGTFSITVNGQTTAALDAATVDAAAIDAAIEALSNVDAGDITVAGTGPWTITYGGSLGDQNITASATDIDLTGGGATVTLATDTEGSAPVNEVQNLSVAGSGGGTFTVTVNGQTTAALDYDITAAELQTALEGLSNVAPGDVTVAAGGDQGTFTLTYGGALAGTDVTATIQNVDLVSARHPSMDPYTPGSEQEVIYHFGEGSPVHRQYLELIAGGAARVSLIGLDAGDTSVATLEQAFEVAEVMRPSIIVPWGRGWHSQTDTAADDYVPLGFAANSATQYLTAAATKCREITNRSFPVFAVMGLAPVTGAAADGTVLPSELNSYITGLATTLPDRDSDALKYIAPYVTVIGAELAPVGYEDGWGFSNGASMFAGLAASLDSWNAPTGKTVYGVKTDGMRFNPTRVQQQSMIDEGVIPVTLNFSRVPTWVDGHTFAQTASDYTRLSTLRIVMETLQRVRTALEIYVGQPATLTHRHAMETTVTSVLREMTLQGAILSSDFVINYSPRENTARIDLVIEPAFEMRTIEVSISVRL